MDGGRSQRNRRRSNPNSTVFKSRQKSDGSGKTDHYFNAPGQSRRHGHVTESQLPDGNTKYHYVRDADGDQYIDDSR